MSIQLVMPQMSTPVGRVGVACGEAAGEPASEETSGPRYGNEDTGLALLRAALTRENLQVAFKRVMTLLRRLYAKLRLKVNETKSAVASVFANRKFLGYSFGRYRGEVKRKMATKALATFKQRVRQLTRRSGGRGMRQVIDRLRHRLRAIQLKQWKHGPTMYRELRALGAAHWVAQKVAANSRCWWCNSAKSLNGVLTIAYFDRLGLPRLS